jgi:hypothetical protein
MRISILLAALVSSFTLAQPAVAQTGAVTSSSPGRVGVAQTVDVSATITAIDKSSRTITLKGPKGDADPAGRA